MSTDELELASKLISIMNPATRKTFSAGSIWYQEAVKSICECEKVKRWVTVMTLMKGLIDESS